MAKVIAIANTIFFCFQAEKNPTLTQSGLPEFPPLYRCMVGNLRRFRVTNDIISGYLLARSGQAWKQAITNKFDRQYWGIKPHTLVVLKQVPTNLTTCQCCLQW